MVAVNDKTSTPGCRSGYSASRLKELATPRCVVSPPSSKCNPGETLSRGYYNELAHRPARVPPSRVNDESSYIQAEHERRRWEIKAQIYQKNRSPERFPQGPFGSAALGELGFPKKRSAELPQQRGTWNPISNTWIIPPRDEKYLDVDGSMHAEAFTALRRPQGPDQSRHTPFPGTTLEEDAAPVEFPRGKGQTPFGPVVQESTQEETDVPRGRRQMPWAGAATWDPISGRPYDRRQEVGSRPQYGRRVFSQYKNMLSDEMATGW